MIKLNPGDNIVKACKAADGEPILLLPGKYSGGSVVGVRAPIDIQGQGVVVVGGGKGLKFENCAAVNLGNFEIHGSSTQGLMVVGCQGFRAVGMHIVDSFSNNLLTANTPNVSIEHCTTLRSKKGHGIYLSQSGDNLSIQHCISDDNARCGIQINAIQPGRRKNDANQDAISRGVSICDSILRGNQKLGAAAINLAGITTGAIERNQVLNHLGRHCIAMWDDGTNKKELACHDIFIAHNEFEFAPGKGSAYISIGRTCTNIRAESNVLSDSSIRLIEQQ